MSDRNTKRNSVASEAPTTTDDGSSAFVTPLATPSELKDQFPSQLDLDENIERTPRRPSEYDDAASERSGTATPKQEVVGSSSGRPRGASQASQPESNAVVESERPPGVNPEEIAEHKQEEHDQERENRELLVKTPEQPATEASNNASPVHSSTPKKIESLDAAHDGAGAGQETDSAADEKNTQETSTGTTVTTENSDENIEEADRAKEESGMLEKQTSQVSITPGDPTGLTTGIAAGASEEKEITQMQSNDESQYPGGLKLALITIGLALATFVVALDNTIIATAIPQITTVFNSLGDVGWYGSSYLLTVTSLQPTFGKVYTHFNIKWTYLSALVIFEIGSVICAAALNSTMLIIGRAVAGVGAAALFSGAMTIIGFTVPLRRRAIFIAMLSSMFGISSVVGPLLGGVFTDQLTWRWCFWINLPFGGIAFGTVLLFFKNPQRKDKNLTFMQKLGEMDLLGAFFLICGIICLLLALQWGGTTYEWSDSRVWGCLLGFGLIIIVFIGLQFWRGDKATIPPRILSQRTVLGGCLFSMFLAMALYAHIFYLPFYFQAVQGTSAEGSGIRTIPYLVSNTIASVVVGGIITKAGYYNPWLYFGSAVFTVGAGLLYTLQVGDYAGKWIGYQLVAGIGAGASIQIPFISVQVVLSSKDMPTGNAVTIFANTLGGALSVSIAQNIFSNFLVQQLAAKAPQVPAQLIIEAGATHVREVTPPQYLTAVLEAYDAAITRAFILPIAVGGIAFLTSALFEWRKIKGVKLEMGGGA